MRWNNFDVVSVHNYPAVRLRADGHYILVQRDYYNSPSPDL